MFEHSPSKLIVAIALLAGCGGNSGGTGIGIGMMGGTDGALCARTDQRAAVQVQLPDNSVLSCAIAESYADGGFQPPVRTFTGRITGGDSHSLVMDDCQAGQSCVVDGIRIYVDATELDLTTIPRVWVQVRFRLGGIRGCQQSLEITAAAPTDGSSSQIPAGLLLLAVDDGGGPLEGSPYGVERVPLGCHSEKGCGSLAPDEYAFDLRLPANTSSSVRVHMGETVSWDVGLHSFRAHNLRSYQTAACDDYWNFAYTIISRP